MGTGASPEDLVEPLREDGLGNGIKQVIWGTGKSFQWVASLPG